MMGRTACLTIRVVYQTSWPSFFAAAYSALVSACAGPVAANASAAAAVTVETDKRVNLLMVISDSLLLIKIL